MFRNLFFILNSSCFFWFLDICQHHSTNGNTHTHTHTHTHTLVHCPGFPQRRREREREKEVIDGESECGRWTEETGSESEDWDWEKRPKSTNSGKHHISFSLCRFICSFNVPGLVLGVCECVWDATTRCYSPLLAATRCCSPLHVCNSPQNPPPPPPPLCVCSHGLFF